MAISQARYAGSWTPNLGFGGFISASGPYVLISQRSSNATGFWLYKRIAGVLTAILTPYTPTTYTPSSGADAWGKHTACWYDIKNSKLQIVVSAIYDDTGGSSDYGAVYFLDWPDSGTVAGDMVELGRINGEFNNHRLGSRLAIADGRAIATEGLSGGTQQVTFYSRSGATWSQDERITCTGYDADGDVSIWDKGNGSILAIIGCPLYNTDDGRIYVRSHNGTAWATETTIDGSGVQQIGKSCSIGVGFGNGTIASYCNVGGGGNGAKIWDRGASDAAWTERGIIKSSGGGTAQAEAIAMGYKRVFFGSKNYLVDAKSNVGAVNVAEWSGTWPVGSEAALLLEPSPSQANEFSTEEDALVIAYQDGLYSRLVSGDHGWDVAASNVGAIIEYEGDSDWAHPPQIVSVAGPDGSPRVSTRGGDVMTVTGSFPVEATMKAYFGLSGDDTDSPCYFGTGKGYENGFSANGTTVEIVAPPHPKTASAILTIVVGGATVYSGDIAVVEHMYSESLYEIRMSWPRDFNTGPRTLDVEPWQD